MARAVTEQEKQMAQQYAQRALEGKGPGGYVRTSQMGNAIINAQVPITEEKISVINNRIKDLEVLHK